MSHFLKVGTTASVEYVSVRDVGIIPNEAHIINYFIFVSIYILWDITCLTMVFLF